LLPILVSWLAVSNRHFEEVRGVKKTRTEITIEVDELLLIGTRRGGSVRIWCPACETEVAMVTPEQAAAAARVSSRMIYRWIEADQLHFTERPDGSLLVCANSLQARRTSIGRF